MDLAQRERMRDDLKGSIEGELLFDEQSCRLYSTDASLFEVEPAGVVVPRHEADIQALVRYAAENGIALVPRGAGTGLAGEALGGGLIVDLSRHFRAILEVGADTVRVQPGVTCRQLARELAHRGRRFAPDPAMQECTIGGMVATNASGARALRHGYTRDHVHALRVVLDSGAACVVSRHASGAAADSLPERLQDVIASVGTLLQQHGELIQHCRPRTPFNRCGYLLHDVCFGEELDLARLLVGSEGTLALVTEATLRTIPLPAGRAMVLLGFASLEAALRAVVIARATGPSACELIDRRLLRLARGQNAVLASLVPATVETVLLIEYEGDSAGQAQQAARALAGQYRCFGRGALVAEVADDEESVELFWQVRQAALPNFSAARGGGAPVPFVEDVGVPVESLGTYLHRVQELLQRHELSASYLVHAATGQVHMRPFLDLQNTAERARLWMLADEVYDLVLELGGTISSQHGTGLARTPWVGRQVGPLLPVWRELKAIFDPRHLFNPGKILGLAPGMPAWPLRRSLTQPASASEPVVEPARAWRLRWQEGEVVGECLNCSGCGACRIESPPQRMCPIFRATGTEAATPRAKANLLRHLLHAETDPRLLSSNEVRAVADLCVNCKMCALECPTRVNVPQLMLEAKAANVAEHGLDQADRVMARAETLAWMGSALAPLVNLLLGHPVSRWVLEKLLGVSRQRRLPSFAARSFLRLARLRGWTHRPRSARPSVAYFVDLFANYNDPLIAEAHVAVLHHNGIEVYVPPGQGGCGMAPLAQGDVETAREMTVLNLRILADVAREGYPILCSEPTAALMLRQDALALLDDPDARLVAAQTVESTAYLWDLHQQGHLRTDFQPLPAAVGHHIPCHLKALGRPPVGPSLLALIPELRVHTIDVSCSGMAGTFGLKAENYAVSLAAGRPMLEELRRPRVLFGSTECSACRLQMEDAGNKRTLHPVQYLALAYGYLPQLRRRLHRPLGKWIL
jgi:FAD/FMN-containing dehydrogenase/Fe-S oxidoreductase